MKHNKKFADRLIGYDNGAPTAWYTLLFLLVAVVSFLHFSFVPTIEVGLTEVHAQDAEAVEAEARAQEEKLRQLRIERSRQEFLAELRHCESTGNDLAKGDSGASNGPYQVQKTTLEDWLGRKVSQSEYYSIVTDYERIHPLVYEAYFERGESWRWKICTGKLTKKQTWEL